MGAFLRMLANPKLLKHTWVILSNPQVLKRFMGTKAGKAAALKYGKMLLESKTVQRMISDWIKKNANRMKNNSEYKKLMRQYAALQQQVTELQHQVSIERESREKLETATFTLGRRVIELQRLYNQLQLQISVSPQQSVARMNQRGR